MDDFKIIPLTQGKSVKVDLIDFEALNKHKWRAQRNYKRPAQFYAVRQKRVDKVKRIFYSMSRQIMKPPKKLQVSFINGDTLDCRRENLRICTHAQKLHNSHKDPKKGFKSKYKGVSQAYLRKDGTQIWQANIRNNGRKFHLGTYDTELKTALAYDKAAKRKFKEFANLNFPEKWP